MSYLIRTGNGRNNIAYGGGKSTKAKYLRRTGTGRTNISWIDISSNSTVNVLERTGTSRNNIRWYNTTFSFIDSRIIEFVNLIVQYEAITLLSKVGSPSYYAYQLKVGASDRLIKLSDDTIQWHFNGTVHGPVTTTTYFIFEILNDEFWDICVDKGRDNYTSQFTCDITTTNTARCDLGGLGATTDYKFIRNENRDFRIGGYAEYSKCKFMIK